MDGIEVKLGDASLLANLHFDVIFANINRNILLADIKKYSACLTKGGELFMSGFYCQDIEQIKAEATKNGLQMTDYKQKNNWAAIKTVKI